MSTAVPTAVLKEFLEQRQVAGQSHVVLRPGMLERLHHARQARTERAREVRQRVAAEPSPTPVSALVREAPAPAPAPAEPTVPRTLTVPGETKAEKLAALAALAESAPEARGLGTLRETMVFAVGSPDAAIMLIGEAPGAEEERQREPFVGPAGQKLTSILTAMGLKRAEVYISNICKFRPAMEDQGSSNRTPTPVEMRACLPFVLTEIEIVQPKIIVALGGTAAAGLGLEGPVSRLRGKLHRAGDIPVIVTYHPSYLLREEKLTGGGLRAKREVWEDMLQVMERAGLPISEKQRGYFRK
jgi:DNA polymerase